MSDFRALSKWPEWLDDGAAYLAVGVGMLALAALVSWLAGVL